MRRALFVLVLLLVPALPGAAQTYIAFGDSITAGVGDESSNAAKGYPPRLETLLRNAGQANAIVRNEGVPGENTDEALTRFDAVLGRGGNVLLLMEGTNDVSRRYSPETTLFNLNQLAIRAEVRGISVIQATVIPRTPRATTDNTNYANQDLNQRIRHQAGTRLRRLADHFEVFGQQADRYARLYDPATDDFVGHPNAAGYDLMARTFFEVITGADTVPPVVGNSQPKQGDRGVNGAQTIRMDVWDFGAGIDLAATRLLVNGTDVGVTAEGDSRRATLTYTPPAALRGAVRLGLRSRDTAATVHTVDREVIKFFVFGIVFAEGDFDRDGRVDGHDLLQFARAFGSRLGDGAFRFSYDLNDDNRIDGEDLAIVAANFGRSAS